VAASPVLDYDNDGWMDVFLVNGSTLEDCAPASATPASYTATITTAPSPT